MLKAELIERAARFRSAEGDPSRALSDCPALVLNADYTPLSYYPLSLWPWQTAIKAVFLERVDIVASYAREVHIPSWTMPIPSVIALRQYVKPSEFPGFHPVQPVPARSVRLPVLRQPASADLRSRRPAAAGRADQLGKRRHRLRAVQPQEGRAHPGAGEDAAAGRTDPPDQLAPAGTRQRLPAQLPA
jgi:hypothetical protein